MDASALRWRPERGPASFRSGVGFLKLSHPGLVSVLFSAPSLVVNVANHACSHSFMSWETKSHLQHEQESLEFQSQVLVLLQYGNADSSFLHFSMAVVAVITNHYCRKVVRTSWCKPRRRLR